jgi:hypothetical protein
MLGENTQISARRAKSVDTKYIFDYRIRNGLTTEEVLRV